MRSLQLLCLLLLGACASPPHATGPSISLPMRVGWFGEREVLYVTTDASDQAVALAEGANYAPRLEAAVSPAAQGGVLERVYAFSDHTQRPVFQSAPGPVGAQSTDKSYSPLWRVVSVAWRGRKQPQELQSEEAILAAEDRGELTLSVTRVVLNCPVVSVAGAGTLPGVTPQAARQ